MLPALLAEHALIHAGHVIYSLGHKLNKVIDYSGKCHWGLVLWWAGAGPAHNIVGRVCDGVIRYCGVLVHQEAGNAMRPGVLNHGVHESVMNILERGLIDHGASSPNGSRIVNVRHDSIGKVSDINALLYSLAQFAAALDGGEAERGGGYFLAQQFTVNGAVAEPALHSVYGQALFPILKYFYHIVMILFQERRLGFRF